MFFFSKNTRQNHETRGFTLVELMVSLSIIVIILGIVVINFSRSGEGTVLTTVAYQVALTIRQAQVYGLSIKASDSNAGDAENYKAGFGVRIEEGSGDIIFFADKVAPGEYNAGQDTIIETVSLQKGYTVNQILKVNNQIDKLVCFTNPCNRSDPDGIDIVFKRPDPDASFKLFGGTGSYASQNGVGIQISAPRLPNTTKYIVVKKTGEITVTDNKDEI